MIDKTCLKAICATALLSVALVGCANDAQDFNKEGIECFEDKEYSDAADLFQKAINKDSDNSQYHVYLGMAQIELCNYDSAMESFQNALRISSSDRDALRGLGIVYYIKGDYDKSLEYLGKVLDLTNGKYDSIALDALVYYAADQMNNEDYDGAVATYTTLISNNYRLNEQYYYRGYAYIKLGDENNAVLDFEASLKEESSNYDMYYNIYYDLIEGGYKDRAISYLKRAIDVKGVSNLLRGKTYYILGEYDNAKSCLQKAIDEGEDEAVYYMAMTYEKVDDVDTAKSMYEEYLNKHADDPNIYNQYGMYYISLKDYKSALSYFEKGIALGKEDGLQELLYNEAVCYEYMGDFTTAYDKFTKYVDKYPNDSIARKEFNFLSSR